MSAQRFRPPKESRMLKLPAVGSRSGHLGTRSTNRQTFACDGHMFTWSIPRTSLTGIRNLPSKQRQAIKKEHMAQRLLDGEIISLKTQNRYFERLKTQISRLKRIA